MLLQYRVCHIEFSPSNSHYKEPIECEYGIELVREETNRGGRKGSIRYIALIRGKKCVLISPLFLSFLSSSPFLSYGDGLYSLKQKQFYLMWLASSSASSTSLILIYFFYFYFYEATSQFQNLLTIRMLVWGEAYSETSAKRSR
ncbi:hypothetical protein Tco_1081165 [Tanacetum coccineum]|uniref:Uncharacterized protein n=1 Tax=Tanacetum coccineum TaxID=301880 RepID=A0ABQ5HWU1_9ASTR